MATSWLKSYERRLAKIAGDGPTAVNYNKSAAQIADEVIASSHPTVSAADIQRASNDSGGGFNWGTFKLGAAAAVKPELNAASRTLDLMSRPLYGFANTVAEGEKRRHENPDNYVSLPKDLSAWWQGFSGKKKTTFADALASDGMKPGLGRAAAGFGLDATLDPLNVVGGTAFKLAGKGIKAAAKAAHLIPEDLVKNVASDSIKVATPAQKAAEDLAATGTAKVKADNAFRPAEKSASDFLKHIKQTKAKEGLHDPANYPFNIVDEQGPADNPAARSIQGLIDSIGQHKALPVGTGTSSHEWVKPAFITDSAGTTSLNLKQSTKALALQTYLDSTKRAMTGVTSRRVFNEPLYTQEMRPVEKQIERIVTEELPKKPVERVVNEKVFSRALQDDPRLEVFAPKGHPAYVEGGAKRIKMSEGVAWAGKDKAKQKALMASVKRTASAMANNADKWKGRLNVRAYDKNLNLKEIPAEHFAQAILQAGKHPAIDGNLEIPYHGQMMTAKDYLAHANSKATDYHLFGEGRKVSKKVIETVMEDQPFPARLTGEAKKAWIDNALKVFSKDEVANLLRSSNEKSYNTRLAKLTNKLGTRDFTSIEELAKAVENGEVPESAAAGILRITNSKTLKQAIAKHKQKVEALARHVNQPEAQGGAYSGLPLSRRAEHGPVPPEQDLWSVNPEPSKVQEAVAKVVKPAQEIVADVAKGDVAPLVTEKANLNPHQADVVISTLKDTAKSQFSDAVDKALYPHKTNRGVARTHANPGEGYGRNRKGFNQRSQYTLWKPLMADTSNTLGKGASPAAKYEYMMPMLKGAEDYLRENGVHLITGDGDRGIPLSSHDILSALGKDSAERLMFNYNTSLAPNQMHQIAELVVDHTMGKIDENTLLSSVTDIMGSPIYKRSTSKAPVYSELSQRFKEATNKGDVGDAEDWVQSNVLDDFLKAAPALRQAVENNSAAAAIKIGEHTKRLTNKVIDNFSAKIMDPNTSSADIIRMVKETGSEVKGTADELGIPLQDGVGAATVKNLETAQAEVVAVPTTQVAAKAAGEFAKANTSAERASVHGKLWQAADDEAVELGPEIDVPIHDLGERLELATGIKYFRAFFPSIANDAVRPTLIARESVAQSNSMKFSGLLSKLNRQYTPDQIKEAFTSLQDGKEGVADSLAPLRNEINNAVKQIFDSDPEYGFLARNGITAAELQRKFDHYGISDVFKLDATTPETLANSWRHWDVRDPLDILSRFHAAYSSLVAEKQTGAWISEQFGRRHPEAGYVKVVDSKGTSRIAGLIDTELYYPKDIVDQMRVLDTTLKELASPAGKSPALRTLDAAMHAYKAGLTIYRPGHHIRNLIGDMWLASMDGVANPTYYARSAKVLATRKSQYNDFDALKALNEAEITRGRPVGNTVLRLKHNGKDVNLDAEQVYRLAYRNGVLPDYSVLEDLNIGGDAKASTKLISKIGLPGKAHGTVHKAAANISEYRDHYVRVAHFLHAMENTKLQGRTLEEALQNAAATAGQRVRKWHPDGSDLSQFEKNVMRRSMLFYSWVRKAIPLVIETAVTHPGRFMLYPKATYDYAEGMGINLNGMGDQFPPDQLFPSFIRNSTQGVLFGSRDHYFGMQPGIPGSDVMDQYFQNPGQTAGTIMGSMNPLAKVPIELQMGKQMNGIPITDKSDYLGSQVPGMTYLDKASDALTGRTVSSGFTQGRHTSPSNEGYNPSIPGIGAINWTSGLGVTDLSKPSYQKAAQFEVKDFLSKLKKRDTTNNRP